MTAHIGTLVKDAFGGCNHLFSLGPENYESFMRSITRFFEGQEIVVYNRDHRCFNEDECGPYNLARVSQVPDSKDFPALRGVNPSAVEIALTSVGDDKTYDWKLAFNRKPVFGFDDRLGLYVSQASDPNVPYVDRFETVFSRK